MIATIDHEARRRTLALQDACDMTRRAVSATNAACVGEPDELRLAVLQGIERRLRSLREQLGMLTR